MSLIFTPSNGLGETKFGEVVGVNPPDCQRLILSQKGLNVSAFEVGYAGAEKNGRERCGEGQQQPDHCPAHCPARRKS